MKIVLVNLRYFISGGPERYLFNIKELLENQGHQVIPFSIKHNNNEPTRYSSYFLEPIGDGNEVYFENYRKKNLKSLIRLAGRLFYSFEARKKLTRLIREHQPDLVYILLYLNKISPSIIHAAKRNGVPVVLRISDYGMMCAANIFYLKRENKICERCLNNGRHHSVLNKCSQGSFLYSCFGYLAYTFHDLLHINRQIDAFVIPSAFSISKFIQFGIPDNKIFQVPTFSPTPENNKPEYERFVLYTGRIEPEKGIRTLIDAFIDTDIPLKIIGFSKNGYDKELQNYLRDRQHAITFLGRKGSEEIAGYLEKCAFTVCPSECYDNFPNAVLESYANKKAVIATNLGSLKEMIRDGETGLLFEYRNSSDLREKVISLIDDKERIRALGENGYHKLVEEYSAEHHYQKLISLFHSLTNA